ncbi:hypothetical protein QE152_g36130 [Popillia japonica]|uniref:DUF7805 domain-containing protein n=1 Tax=Popillia japonica TaxID=7064 RepID=A0AAW1IE34_POPJA
MDTTVSPSPIPFRPLQPRYPDGYWRDSAIVFPPPRYRVWLSVVKFYVSGGRGIQKMDQEICRSYLNVWDGQLWTPTNCNGLYCGLKDKSKGKSSPSSLGSRNVTMLARYCKEHIPRTCDHSMLANSTRYPRPCTLSESYLSSGDSLTLELRLADATALRPVRFRVLYEFVDLHQDGEPLADGPCNRKFTNLQDGIKKFQAPKDIFLYGRGGAKNISCVYRFEAQKDEKIKIILTDLVIKNRDCRSRISPDTDRYQCYGNTSATVRIFDIPWPDVPGVPRDCFCSTENEAGQHFVFVSTSNIVELRFNVIGMNASDDFTTLFFEGTWKFVRAPICTMDLRKSGASGEIILRHPMETTDEINCENYPRVMIPAANKYLYVKLHGIILKHLDKQGNETTVSQMKCSTTNRITVHTPLFSAIICPQEIESRQHNLVELFSEGWHLNQHKFFPVDRIGIDYLGKELPRTIMVEFMGKEPGTYSVTWLELRERIAADYNGGVYGEGARNIFGHVAGIKQEKERSPTKRNRFNNNDARRMRTPLPRTRRMHQHNSMVRWPGRLSFWNRRSSNPLLPIITTPAALPLPGSSRHPPVLLHRLPDPVEDVPAKTSFHTANPPEKSQFGHRYHRREGRNMLTQRQFCALR